MNQNYLYSKNYEFRLCNDKIWIHKFQKGCREVVTVANSCFNLDPVFKELKQIKDEIFDLKISNLKKKIIQISKDKNIKIDFTY
jgi:hypothetical protein